MDRRDFMKSSLLTSLASMNVKLNASNAQPAGGEYFERTFESRKVYADPFNDVDVDVTFSRDSISWRVPAFWRGGSRWGVRFAPPSPGEYTYRLECTDRDNPDLNGKEERVTTNTYAGTNSLLRRGMLRVSANKRYFEHADGTPFYWLGDTWWTLLSTRISWDGFQKLAADRKAKGFTAVQICAGLIPNNEEKAPVDPGYCNEGGCVWDPEFKRINPKYFDFADRRIQCLVDMELVPVVVGAWHQALGQMGVAKMKKHWRYVIARYGAYPVFWIVGGEVFDPPKEVRRKMADDAFFVRLTRSEQPLGGWTEVARYIRMIDPYHHPLSVHEVPPPYDFPLEDESLMDFDFFQPSHFGWPSIATSVALLDKHYARTTVTKPLVVAEIGYEKLGETQLEGFQRVAFWSDMLNGAAGHTYGAAPTFEGNSTDKPFHRRGQYSFRTWDEGMNFLGSYQVGIGAKFLRQYPWQRFGPHPEWVVPRGTTLLEPNDKVRGFDIDLIRAFAASYASPLQPLSPCADLPAGEWKKHHGNFRLPYAAGIPGELRFVYMPYFGLFTPESPTVLKLEPGVRYHAFYWEPVLGIKFDLGMVQRPAPGAIIRADKFEDGKSSSWKDYGTTKSVYGKGKLSAQGGMLAVLNGVSETNLVAAVDVRSDAEAGLVLRFRDAENYLAAIYDSKEKVIFLLDSRKGIDGKPLGKTEVPEIGFPIRLTAEVRDATGAVSVTDGRHTYMTPIVNVIGNGRLASASDNGIIGGGVGLMYRDHNTTQSFNNFELRKSPTLIIDDHLERKLYDAQGRYRGELKGPGWNGFARNKIILLDGYRPDRMPCGQDWVLVLETRQ